MELSACVVRDCEEMCEKHVKCVRPERTVRDAYI